MTSNGLFIDLTSVNTKCMNVGYNVGHYIKVGHDLDLEIYLKSSFWSVHHGNHIFDTCLVTPK